MKSFFQINSLILKPQWRLGFSYLHWKIQSRKSPEIQMLACEQSCANMYILANRLITTYRPRISIFSSTILRMMTMTHLSHIQFKTKKKQYFYSNIEILSKLREKKIKENSQRNALLFRFLKVAFCYKMNFIS